STVYPFRPRDAIGSGSCSRAPRRVKVSPRARRALPAQPIEEVDMIPTTTLVVALVVTVTVLASPAAAEAGGKGKAATPSAAAGKKGTGKDKGSDGAADDDKKKADPRGKRRRPARPKAMAGGGPYEITAQGAKGKIVPFPSEAAAVTKAFADH